MIIKKVGLMLLKYSIIIEPFYYRKILITFNRKMKNANFSQKLQTSANILLLLLFFVILKIEKD